MYFRKLFKTSAYKSILLSFIIVLILPVIFNLFFSFRSTKIIRQQIDDSNEIILSQIQQVIDSKIADIDNLSNQLSYDSELEGLLYSKNELSVSHQYSIFKLIRSYKVYLVANSFIRDFYVYLKDSNRFITSSSFYNNAMTYSAFHKNSIDSLEEWERLINQQYSGTFVLNHQSGTEQLLYMKSLPLNDRETKGNMVFIIDPQKMLSSLRSIKSLNNRSYLILNHEGAVISSTVQDLPFLASDLYQMYHQSDKNIILHGYSISCIKSKFNDWLYVSFIPVESYMKNFNDASFLNLMCLISILILGSMLIFFLTKNMYMPISHIMNRISNIGYQPETKQDEYGIISNAFDSTVSENKHLKGIINNHESILREQFFLNILLGKSEVSFVSDSKDEELEVYGLKCKNSRYYYVALIKIENYGILSSLPVNSSDVMAKEKQLASFVVKNVCRDILEKCLLYTLHTGDEVIAIMKTNAADEDSSSEITTGFERINEFLSKNFNVRLSISVGRSHLGITGIQASFNDAKEAMEYRFTYGKHRVLFYSDVYSDKMYIYSTDINNKLYHFLKAANYNEVKNIIDEIFDYYSSNRDISVKWVRCVIIDIINIAVKVIDEVSNHITFVNDIKPVERIIACDHIADAKTEITLLMSGICTFINHKNLCQNDMIKQIDSIIENYIRSKDICVNFIAESLKMNPMYISRYYKERTGVGILDNIHRMKIKLSKELLTEGKLSIVQVAETVGFNHINSFIRIFKQYEGITPGKYKESLNSTNGL